MPPHPEPENQLYQNFATHQYSRENRKDSILVQHLPVLVTHLNFVVFVLFLYCNHLGHLHIDIGFTLQACSYKSTSNVLHDLFMLNKLTNVLYYNFTELFVQLTEFQVMNHNYL
jgi:hypothetical protein